MKHNNTVIPMLFTKKLSLSVKMFMGFFRMACARLFPRRSDGFNHMKNLSLVYFKLTPLCNLRCVMCGQWGDNGVMKSGRPAEESNKLVSLERYKEIADELAPRKPVIYLWGGEPFLYPDLMPLAKYMVEKGLFLSINTNGTFLEQHAEQIVRDGWSAIFVSLDGFEETNDAMRGKGSYQRVIRGIEAVNREKKKQKRKHPIISIVTVVTSMNYLDIENLAEATRGLNLDLHVFNLGTYTNDSIVAAHRRFMEEKLNSGSDYLEAYNTGYNKNIDGEKLHRLLKNLHKKNYGHPILTVPALNPEKTNTYYANLEEAVRNRCIVPWCQANINYNGDIHFCADYPDYILGNIKESSFTEIYNSGRANLFRKTINACPGGMFPGCLRCYQNMLFGEKIRGF